MDVLQHVARIVQVAELAAVTGDADAQSLADVLRAQNEYERRLPSDDDTYNHDEAYQLILHLATRGELTFQLKLEAFLAQRRMNRTVKVAHPENWSSDSQAARPQSSLPAVSFASRSGFRIAGANTHIDGRDVSSSRRGSSWAANDTAYRVPSSRAQASSNAEDDELNAPSIKRRVSIIRDWAAHTGSGLVDPVEGTVRLDFDTIQYENMKRLSRSFRRWVAFVAAAREERGHRQADAAASDAAARVALMRRALRGLREACINSRLERQKLIVALEHWAVVTLRKAFDGWKASLEADTEAAVARAGAVCEHPTAVRAVFKWIATSLPERYSGHDSLSGRYEVPHGQGTAAGRRTSAGHGREVDPDLWDEDHAAYGHSRHHINDVEVEGDADGQYYDDDRDGQYGEADDGAEEADAGGSGAGARPSRRGRRASPGRSGRGVGAGIAGRASGRRYSGHEHDRDGDGDPLAASRVSGVDRRSPLRSTGRSARAGSGGPGHATSPGRVSSRVEGRLRSYLSTRLQAPPHRIPALHKALAVVDAHTLASVFCAWKQEWQQGRAARNRCMGLQATRAVRLWAEAAVQRRKMRRAGSHLFHRLQSNAFHSWLAYVAHRRAMADLKAKADQHCTMVQQRRALATWRAAVPVAQRQRMRVAFDEWRTNAARRRKALGLLRAVRGECLSVHFHRWKTAVTVLAPQERAEADEHATGLALRPILVLWRQALASRRRMRTVVQTLSQVKQSHALRTWRENAAQRRHEKFVMARIIAIMSNHRVAAFIRTWRWGTKEAARAQELRQRAVANWTNRQLGNGLRAWRANVAQIRYEKELQRSALTHMVNQRLGFALHSWRDFLATRKANRATIAMVVANMRKHRAGAAIRSWHDYLLQRKAEKAVMATVLTHWRNKKFGAALRTWRDRAATRRAAREVALGVATHFKKKNLGAAVRAWRQWTVERMWGRGMKTRVVLSLQNLSLRRALNSWRDLKAEKSRRRAILAQALARMRQRSLFMAFNSLKGNWEEALVKGEQADELYESLAPLRAVRALRRFKDKTSQLRRNRELVRRAMALWQNSLVARAFRAWDQYYDGKVKASAQLEKAVNSMINMRALAGLRAWRDKAQTRKYHRSVVANAVHHMLHRRLYAAFASLRDAVVDGKARRATAEERYWTVQNRTMSSCLQSLKAHVAARKDARAKLARLQTLVVRGAPLRAGWQQWCHGMVLLKEEQEATRKAVSSWYHRSQRRAFNGWRQYVARRQAVRDTARVISGRLHRFEELNAIRAWRAFVRAKQYGRQLDGHAVAGAAKTAIRRWRTRKIEIKQARLQGTMVADMLSRCYDKSTMARVWAAWRAYTARSAELGALRAQLRRKVEGRWATAALHAWKEQAAESQAVAALAHGRIPLAPAPVRSLMHVAACRMRHDPLMSRAFSTLKLYTAHRKAKAARLAVAQQHYERAASIKAVGTAKALLVQLRQSSRHTRDLEAQAEAHWQTKCSRAVLAKMQAQAKKQKRQRQALQLLFNCVRKAVLRRAVSSWHMTAADAAREERLDGIAAAYFATKRCAQALACLRSFTHRQAHLKATALKVAGRCAARTLRKAVGGWRAATTEQRTYRMADGHAAKAACLRAIRGWRKETRAAAVQSFSARVEARRVSRAVAEWRRTARISALVTKHVGVTRHARELHGVTSWLEWTRHRRNMRLRVHAAVLHAGTDMKRKVFSAWAAATREMRAYRAEVAAQQEIRLALDRRSERTRLNTLRVVFDTWRQRIRITKRCREIAAAFTVKTNLQPSFNAWRAHTHKQALVKTRVATVIRKFRANALRRVFDALKESAHLGRAARAHRQVVLGRFFGAWKAAAITSRLVQEHRLGVAMHHQQAATRGKVFSAWRAYAHKKAELHALTARLQSTRTQRRLRQGLRSWMVQARAAAHARMVDERSARLYDRQLLIRCFTSWAALTYKPRGGGVPASPAPSMPRHERVQPLGPLASPTHPQRRASIEPKSLQHRRGSYDIGVSTPGSSDWGGRSMAGDVSRTGGGPSLSASAVRQGSGGDYSALSWAMRRRSSVHSVSDAGARLAANNASYMVDASSSSAWSEDWFAGRAGGQAMSGSASGLRSSAVEPPRLRASGPVRATASSMADRVQQAYVVPKM